MSGSPNVGSKYSKGGKGLIVPLIGLTSCQVVTKAPSHRRWREALQSCKTAKSGNDMGTAYEVQVAESWIGGEAHISPSSL